jgi:hypothetical protein
MYWRGIERHPLIGWLGKSFESLIAIELIDADQAFCGAKWQAPEENAACHLLSSCAKTAEVRADLDCYSE